MKRIAACLLVVLAGAPLSAVAGEGAPCIVLMDPRADTATADSAETAAQPAWIDIASVRVGADLLVIDVPELASLDPSVPGASIYEVTWRAGGTRAYAQAVHDAGRWRFQQGRIVSEEVRTSRVIDGAVTRRAVRIRADLPAAMNDVRAMASARPTGRGPSTYSDRAPNLGARGATAQPGGGCIDAGGVRCLVATDDIADSRAVHADQQPAENRSDAAEIVAVELAVNATSLLAEIKLGSGAPIAGADGIRWEVAWHNPWLDEHRALQVAFAERRGERLEFGYDIGDGWTSAQGALLDEDRIVRIALPREVFGIPDGTRIRDLAAASFAVRGTALELRDRAPDAGGRAWVAGPSCSQREAPVCPVAVDTAGDGRMIEATDETPRNEGWLDIRAAGARADADRLVMSVRVASLRVPEPTAADLTGWTISWDHAGRRWFAQAERGATGITYRTGARGAGTGPVFGGVRTTGSLDLARGLITIVVPRVAAGAPADGTALDGFEAASWASYGTGTTVATIQVVDSTATRRYLTGTDCSA